MTMRVTGGSNYTNGSGSLLIRTGATDLIGIFVASSSSGTIKVWDNTSAATTILVNTFSAAAATWYALPFRAKTGVFVEVSGTIDYTVSWNFGSA